MNLFGTGGLGLGRNLQARSRHAGQGDAVQELQTNLPSRSVMPGVMKKDFQSKITFIRSIMSCVIYVARHINVGWYISWRKTSKSDINRFQRRSQIAANAYFPLKGSVS